MRHSCKLHFLPFFSVLLVFAASAPLAHATPITYDLISANTSAGALTGTVSIDSLTDLVTAADITFNYQGVGLFTFTSVNSSGAWSGLGQSWIAGTSPIKDSTSQIALFYDTAKIGTGNLDLCLFNGPQCGAVGLEDSTLSVYYPGAFNANLTAGSLHPESAAATPEPVSLALLGTGILAIAVFGRFKVFPDREDAE